MFHPPRKLRLPLIWKLLIIPDTHSSLNEAESANRREEANNLRWVVGAFHLKHKEYADGMTPKMGSCTERDDSEEMPEMNFFMQVVMDTGTGAKRFR